MKKDKQTFDYVLLFIILFTLLFTSFSLLKNVPELQSLNVEYNEQYSIYQNYIEEQKKLKSITDDDKRTLAEQKARDDGYSCPDDTVFYDIL